MLQGSRTPVLFRGLRLPDHAREARRGVSKRRKQARPGRTTTPFGLETLRGATGAFSEQGEVPQMRSRTNLAFALGVALAAPTGGLAAQNRLPDSLSWTRLPDDPNDMPQYVMARAGKLGGDPFRAGCPADGGYGEAAYEALVLAAETDAELRGEVEMLLGGRLKMWGKGERDEGNCTDDIPRFEAWLAGQLRREWEGGAMEGREHGTYVGVGPPLFPRVVRESGHARTGPGDCAGLDSVGATPPLCRPQDGPAAETRRGGNALRRAAGGAVRSGHRAAAARLRMGAPEVTVEGPRGGLRPGIRARSAFCGPHPAIGWAQDQAHQAARPGTGHVKGPYRRPGRPRNGTPRASCPTRARSIGPSGLPSGDTAGNRAHQK